MSVNVKIDVAADGGPIALKGSEPSSIPAAEIRSPFELVMALCRLGALQNGRWIL